jgi:sodium-dependent dicarboxylate transporter 2/3/5
LQSIGVNISFLGWMMFAVPVAIVLTVASCFTLILVFLRDNRPIQPELIECKPVEQSRKLTGNRRIVITVLIVTIMFWLTGSYLGITVASVTAIPLVVFTLTGVISGNDVRTLPWDTLLLVAGGLSLGVALQQTDLLNYYSAKIVELGFNPVTVLIILAYLAMLIANFMSASAIVTVLIPLAFVGVPIMVPIPPTIAARGTPNSKALVTPDFLPNEVIKGVMAATTIAVAAALDIIIDVNMVVIINPKSRFLGFVPEMRTANWKKRSSSFVFFIANARKKPPSIS